MAKALDLAGCVFGDWTVLRRAQPRPKFGKDGKKIGTTTYWICRCSCGIEKEVITDSLRSGRSTNCGHKAEEKHHSTYVGETFYFLTVLRTYMPDKGMARAECACACGSTKDVPIQALLNGTTKSCGCLRKQASQQRMQALYSRHEMVKDDNHIIRGWKPKEQNE